MQMFGNMQRLSLDHVIFNASLTDMVIFNVCSRDVINDTADVIVTVAMQHALSRSL